MKLRETGEPRRNSVDSGGKRGPPAKDSALGGIYEEALAHPDPGDPAGHRRSDRRGGRQVHQTVRGPLESGHELGSIPTPILHLGKHVFRGRG